LPEIAEDIAQGEAKSKEEYVAMYARLEQEIIEAIQRVQGNRAGAMPSKWPDVKLMIIGGLKVLLKELEPG